MPSKIPNVTHAEFLKESRSITDLVTAGRPEIAFAGRSNVGKSTLVNALAQRRALTRTSKTPGRTKGIMFYDVSWRFPKAKEPPTNARFVDLPGYGYAAVAREERDAWGPLMDSFVSMRGTICMFLVLIDSRRGPQDEEREAHKWLTGLNIPHVYVATKMDKLSPGEQAGLPKAFALDIDADAPPYVVAVSSQSGKGLEGLWRVLTRATAEAPKLG